MVATSHIWLVSTWNVATLMEELLLNFIVLINLNLSSHIWLVASVLNSTALKFKASDTESSEN